MGYDGLGNKNSWEKKQNVGKMGNKVIRGNEDIELRCPSVGRNHS